MYNFNNSTIVASLTIGQLRELISEFFSNETRPVETEKKNLVYGLRGIMSLLHCSHTQAQRYKDGILKDAVMQNGRKIVVDADKALELFRKSGKCLWLFARGLSTENNRRSFVLLAVSQTEKVSEPEPIPSLPSQSSLPSTDLPVGVEASDDEPDVNDGSDASDGKERIEMPSFYKQVKDRLPKFLKKVAQVNNTDSDADLLILGALGVISACLPGIHGLYGGDKLYPNLYLFVTARAGSGKGRLYLSKSIVDPIHHERLTLNEKSEKKYYQDRRAYKQSGNRGSEPVAPPIRLLFLPANSSATAVYQALSENDEQGLMFETEGDTLASTFGQDFGNFSDGLRKAFHHESISYLRRSEREYVHIETPRLSVVLSGTPQQVVNLIPNVENGLFSRFLFYYLDQKLEWIDVFAEGDGRPLGDYFNKLGHQFLRLYHNLKKRPEIRIDLTDEQRKRFHLYFSRLQADYVAFFGEGIIASVRRLGVSTFRISMILSALRILEDKDYGSTRLCSDKDFEIAMDMCRVLQQHMVRVMKELPVSKKGAVQAGAKDPLLIQEFWDSLPEEFNTQEYKAIALKLGISVPSAERYIRQWLITRLDKLKRGKYRRRK